MMGIESRDCLHYVAMDICMESTSIATHKHYKPWHESLGHCDDETSHDALPYIAGVNEDEFNNKMELCRPSFMENQWVRHGKEVQMGYVKGDVVPN